MPPQRELPGQGPGMEAQEQLRECRKGTREGAGVVQDETREAEEAAP